MAEHMPNNAALVPAPHADLVFQERPIPSPGPNEVVIRNKAIAVNPIDWKRQAWNLMVDSYPVVLGSDVGGIVHEVGTSVTRFARGDHVIGFAGSFITHNDDHAAFQTYTVISVDGTAHLPKELDFKQGATLPQALGTSAMAFFESLGLPLPATNEQDKAATMANHSILVWGGSSSTGRMMIQFARLLGFSIFATASERHHESLKSLGAAFVVDYKSSRAVEDLVRAAERTEKPITYAIDCVASAESVVPLARVLSKSSRFEKLAMVLPWPEDVPQPEGLMYEHVRADFIWSKRPDLLHWLFHEALPQWFKAGTIRSMPVKVVVGGIGGLQEAMNVLKEGVSGEKIVVEV